MTPDELVARFVACCSAASDKVWGHAYQEPYGRVVLPCFDLDTPVGVLEIGVHNGGSLRLWEALFPSWNTRVYGIDIDLRCVESERSPRTRIFIGDQADGAFLARVTAETGPLDLIVDDGSHAPDDYLASFAALWPWLNPGGVYVVEDLVTADLWPFSHALGGALPSPEIAWSVAWSSSSPGRWIGMLGKAPEAGGGEAR